MNKPNHHHSKMEARSYDVSSTSLERENHAAKCIELPGCLSEGKMQSQALKNIQDAIKLYLDYLLQDTGVQLASCP